MQELQCKSSFNSFFAPKYLTAAINTLFNMDSAISFVYLHVTEAT